MKLSIGSLLLLSLAIFSTCSQEDDDGTAIEDVNLCGHDLGDDCENSGKQIHHSKLRGLVNKGSVRGNSTHVFSIDALREALDVALNTENSPTLEAAKFAPSLVRRASCARGVEFTFKNDYDEDVLALVKFDRDTPDDEAMLELIRGDEMYSYSNGILEFNFGCALDSRVWFAAVAMDFSYGWACAPSNWCELDISEYAPHAILTLSEDNGLPLGGKDSIQCKGHANRCWRAPTENRCDQIEGCGWYYTDWFGIIGECLGIATRCYEITSEGKCNSQPGCQWAGT